MHSLSLPGLLCPFFPVLTVKLILPSRRKGRREREREIESNRIHAVREGKKKEGTSISVYPCFDRSSGNKGWLTYRLRVESSGGRRRIRKRYTLLY